MLMHVTNDIKCGVQVFFQYRKMHIHRTSRLYSGDVGGIQAVRKDMVGYLWKIGEYWNVQGEVQAHSIAVVNYQAKDIHWRKGATSGTEL